MHPMIKVLVVGIASVAMSDWVSKTFSGEGDSDNEKLMWRFGGGAAGALVAGKLLKL